jgi:predicted nucleic acid-binding protein
MIAVDASTMIQLLTNAPGSSRIAALLDDDIVAPELLIAEVTRFLARLERHGEPVAPARSALADAAIDYVPTWPHAERMWELRHNVSPYDACYVVVAETMECPLLTADTRLGRATGLRTDVILAPTA